MPPNQPVPGDAAGVRTFLASLDSLPPADALQAICHVLAALGDGDHTATSRLEVLEELRPPVWRALAAFEHDHLARVLPFTTDETQRWRLYIEAWSLLLGVYLRCLADADAGVEGISGLTPLLVQRVLRQAGQLAAASYRAYQGVAPDLWLLAHDHLRRAEKAGWADLAVADATLPLEGTGTPAEAWLHMVVLDYSDPYAMTALQLALANRWLEQLVRYVRRTLEPVAHGNTGYLVAWLERAHGVRLTTELPVIDPGREAPRFLVLEEAREQVRRLLAKLQLDIPPQDLYLGERCSRDDAIHLLEHLGGRWRPTRKRALPRRAVNAPAQVAVGLTAIHRYLSRQALDAPLPAVTPPSRTPAPERDGLEDEAMASLDPTSPLFTLLEAQIVDQSPTGVGLLQRDPSAGRLRCHQLLAVLTGREILLGSVRWLSIDPSAGLRFGFKVIPGQARPVRVLTSSTEEGSYERALLLPALPALDVSATLVTAPGIYFPNRLMRLWPEAGEARSHMIELTERLLTGSDFERVVFRIVD